MKWEIRGRLRQRRERRERGASPTEIARCREQQAGVPPPTVERRRRASGGKSDEGGCRSRGADARGQRAGRSARRGWGEARQASENKRSCPGGSGRMGDPGREVSGSTQPTPRAGSHVRVSAHASSTQQTKAQERKRALSGQNEAPDRPRSNARGRRRFWRCRPCGSCHRRSRTRIYRLSGDRWFSRGGLIEVQARRHARHQGRSALAQLTSARVLPAWAGRRVLRPRSCSARIPRACARRPNLRAETCRARR